MAAQLQVASEIQKTFLPSTFPAMEGVDGSVASVAALEVGGDFYDVLSLPGGRTGFLVGDVSGKGVPGALFGARLMVIYCDDLNCALSHELAERLKHEFEGLVPEDIRVLQGGHVALRAAGRITNSNPEP